MRLSDRDLKNYLSEGIIKMSPSPDLSSIKGVSVDLRLGHSFRVYSGHVAPYVDLSATKDQLNKTIDSVMGKEITISDDELFFLHPGELVLAVTHECVQLPDTLVGWLDGRSSLARLGLMVHVTAHRIDPGWEGQIVLEFYNNGKLPLALKTLMPICALSFEQLSSPAGRPYNKRSDAKYHKQQGPIASLIAKD